MILQLQAYYNNTRSEYLFGGWGKRLNMRPVKRVIVLTPDVKGDGKSQDDFSILLNGNDISFSGIIKGDSGATGFSITNSFDIRVVIKDRLSTYIFPMTLGTGIPSIAITKKGVAINGMYDNTIKGALQIWNGDVYVNGKKLTIN